MKQTPFFKITPDGIVDVQPAPAKPRTDYTSKPVHVAVGGDSTIELHGENFSVKSRLSVDATLSLIMLLSYGLRESLHAQSEAAK